MGRGKLFEECCEAEAVDEMSKMTDEEVIEERVKYYKERLTERLEAKKRAELNKIAQQKFIDENKDLIKECDDKGVTLPFDLRFIHPDTETDDDDDECEESVSTNVRLRDSWAEKYTWLTDEEIESMKQQVFKYHERQKEIINEHFCHINDKKYRSGQLDALIDEYASIEKLKLVLVDRIRSNIAKRDINLSYHQFALSNK